MSGPLRVGIGGPVGAGKTTLAEGLCRVLAGELSMAVVTNDIYTREDAEALMRAQVLPLDRIRGVETGGCPHTAIREDASINLAALAELNAAHPDLELVLIEFGGRQPGRDVQPGARRPDHLCHRHRGGTGHPAQAGAGPAAGGSAGGQQGGPGAARGRRRGAAGGRRPRLRGGRPVVVAALRHGRGLAEIADFVCVEGGLPVRRGVAASGPVQER